jgi:hypothetical protein
MLAPRSFLFSRQQTPEPPTFRNSKDDRTKSRERTRSPAIKHEAATLTSNSDAGSRPSTPTSPVVIPTRANRDPAQHQRPEVRAERHQSGRKQSQARASERRARAVHSPDSIPPSVAALLAITAIPPPRSSNGPQRPSGAQQRLTVDSILKNTAVSEKEFSMSLGKGPLDFLLSPPDDIDEDTVGSEMGPGSLISTRTISSELIPSLDGSVSSSPSYASVTTPGSRGKRSLPTRGMRRLSSPPGETVFDDPLSRSSIDLDSLDFRVFERPQTIYEKKSSTQTVELPRRKSAFKSNLTASLKALRSAARSFSTMATPLVTPDDFLTRSIISIDPRVPFTDERMPPRLEDTPTPALRRYLNPTTNAPIEAHIPSSSLTQTMSAPRCTTSIQMQTYKISRSSQSSTLSIISRRTQTTPEEVFADVATGPLARQRDMRENSDFIRVAVLEMAMRRKGKLDDQKPGRARWALPPRKPSTKPYEIGQNGVPVRWVAVTC